MGARGIRRAAASAAVVLLLCAGGAGFPGAQAAASPSAPDYLTFHFDNARTGWNPYERVLTAKTVTPQRFGRLFSIPVDGQVYAQPLYVHDVAIPGKGRHNVLLVATQQDSVYAFDADTGTPLWRQHVAGCCGAEPVDVSAIGFCHVSPKVGVSSTPVVDRATGTVYVVAKAMRRAGGGVTFHHSLHALSLETGRERQDPVEITGTTTLSDRGVFTLGPSWKHSLRRLLGNTLRFDPAVQYSRTALLLDHGVLYFGYGSHCHNPEAHGWIFAYRARDLRQLASFVTLRDWQADNGGGVWQGGYGLSADGDSVYATTSNGPFDANDGGLNYGDSVLKLATGRLTVKDSFTPYTQAELAANQADLGGSGVVLLPDQPGRHRHLAVVASKVRAIFLLDRDHLGGYTPNGPDKVLQVIGDEHDRTDWCIGTCGGPAYYDGPTGELVFDVWAQDALRAYRLVDAPRPHLVPAGRSAYVFPGSGGAIPAVSSNGKLPGTGIVWVTTRRNIDEVRSHPVELLAYDATNLSRLLYRGAVGFWPNERGHPFLTPTVVSGKVYVGGWNSVVVFGLTNASGRTPRSQPLR